jgi:hypothetical protein
LVGFNADVRSAIYCREIVEKSTSCEMTAIPNPRNLLEYHLNEASARRAAEKIVEGTKRSEAVVDGGARKELRKIEVKDQSGRVITLWEGSPRLWMQYFSMALKKVVAINTR